MLLNCVQKLLLFCYFQIETEGTQIVGTCTIAAEEKGHLE